MVSLRSGIVVYTFHVSMVTKCLGMYGLSMVRYYNTSIRGRQALVRVLWTSHITCCYAAGMYSIIQLHDCQYVNEGHTV